MDHRDDDVFDDQFDEQGKDREKQARSFLNIKFLVCDVYSSNTKVQVESIEFLDALASLKTMLVIK